MNIKYLIFQPNYFARGGEEQFQVLRSVFNGHPEDCHRLIPQLECLGGAHIGGVVAKDVVESEEKTQNKKKFLKVWTDLLW